MYGPSAGTGMPRMSVLSDEVTAPVVMVRAMGIRMVAVCRSRGYFPFSISSSARTAVTRVMMGRRNRATAGAGKWEIMKPLSGLVRA